MKHEVTSQQTKRLLANSLKERMAHQALSKITVREIIEDCHVNRNTFYYHFTDIYALLEWMLKQETIEVIKQFDLMTSYEDAIRFVLRYVQENKHILACSYDAMGRAGLKRFFYDDFIHIVRLLIDDLEKCLLLHAQESVKSFLCEFYSEALAGILLSNVTGENHYTPEEMIEHMSVMFKYSLTQMLIYADEKRKWEKK